MTEQRILLVLAEGDTITVGDLPEPVLAGARTGRIASAVEALTDVPTTRAAGLRLREAREHWMAVLEASHLREVLDRHQGNISAAATAASVDRKTFHRLIHKHQIRSYRASRGHPGWRWPPCC